MGKIELTPYCLLIKKSFSFYKNKMNWWRNLEKQFIKEPTKENKLMHFGCASVNYQAEKDMYWCYFIKIRWTEEKFRYPFLLRKQPEKIIDTSWVAELNNQATEKRNKMHLDAMYINVNLLLCWFYKTFYACMCVPNSSSIKFCLKHERLGKSETILKLTF